MPVRKYIVNLTSRTALLLHHNNIAARDEDGAAGKSGGKAGDDRYPADRWKRCLYLFGGQLVMPTENVLASLLKVGGSIAIGGKKTLKAASQAIYFDDAYLPLRLKDGRTLNADGLLGIKGDFGTQCDKATEMGFELFIKPCRVNNKGHIRVRPRFEQWSVEGSFETDEDDLTTPRIKTLFETAGRRSGLGDWRPGSPSKPGPFGTFRAEIEEVE